MEAVVEHKDYEKFFQDCLICAGKYFSLLLERLPICKETLVIETVFTGR